MGSITARPDGSFQVVWKKKALLGKPKYKTFETLEKAKKANEVIQAQIDAGIFPPLLQEDAGLIRDPALNLSFEQIATEFVTQTNIKVSESARNEASYVVGDIGQLSLHEINISTIERWVETFKEKGRTPGTIRKRVSTASRVWQYAMRTYPAIKSNPFDLLQAGYSTYPENYSKGKGEVKDKHRDQRISEELEQEICDIVLQRKMGSCAPNSGVVRSADPYQLFMIIKVAINTCARLSEVFTIYTESVDLERCTIQLTKEKNKKVVRVRAVPINSDLLALLSDYLSNHHNGSQFLFPAFWNGRMDRKYMQSVSQSIGNTFQNAAGRAGEPGLTFHSTRHEGISRIFERTTLDSARVAQITGHKSERQLAKYTHLRTFDLAKALW